jgi:glycosyltransferase involved in cell wall biosynthesis
MHKVCIVIPCYNEEHRLRTADILEFLHSQQWVSVCFVDDGSSDRTRAALDRVRAGAPLA